MLIIFNPAAGQRRRQRLGRALAWLDRLGCAHHLAETTHPGHAMALARAAAAAGVPLVVAAGGDGTIAEVAAGLDGSGAAMGVLPLGTANVFAWELGIPIRPEAAAAALAAGRCGRVHPGIARFGDGSVR
ncbi:MAG: diacylglycerol kinase family lipid kinase, partial [Acetobacteraceae bacterium]